MTPEEERICAEYSARDKHGKVHCDDCPLGDGHGRCKKNEEMREELKRTDPDIYELLYGKGKPCAGNSLRFGGEHDN